LNDGEDKNDSVSLLYLPLSASLKTSSGVINTLPSSISSIPVFSSSKFLAFKNESIATCS
jgi:hypothetical protein